jgi:hypothetical protein
MLATLPYIDSSATADASIVNVDIIIFNMFVVFWILSQMWNLIFLCEWIFRCYYYDFEYKQKKFTF